MPSHPVNHRFSISTGALALAVWCLGAIVFFRPALWSGFDVIAGNNADTRFIVFLHEHLFQWLRGNAEFLSPKFFYPQPNTLGYSDAFLLNLVPYATFRLLGFDPFLSLQLWIVAGSALCFWSSLLVLVRYLNIRIPIALVAALLITFPNNLFFKAVHAQFYALYYVPALVLIFLRGLEDFPRMTARLLAHVAICALLYALLFSTSFYTAWLFGLTIMIAGAAAALMSPRQFAEVLSANRRPVSTIVGVGAVAFAIGLVPLAAIYAPILGLFEGRTFREYISYAPFPVDIINVSVEIGRASCRERV